MEGLILDSNDGAFFILASTSQLIDVGAWRQLGTIYGDTLGTNPKILIREFIYDATIGVKEAQRSSSIFIHY